MPVFGVVVQQEGTLLHRRRTDEAEKILAEGDLGESEIAADQNRAGSDRHATEFDRNGGVVADVHALPRRHAAGAGVVAVVALVMNLLEDTAGVTYNKG